MLQQADGYGVDLLAAGAAGHPDAQRVARLAALEQRRKRRAREGLEALGIAEETGDADQHILRERVQLHGVLIEELCVGLQPGDTL